MGTVKQINIENRTYCFYNDIIDPENFDSKTLVFTILDILKKIGDCKNIYSWNPLYLGITMQVNILKK